MGFACSYGQEPNSGYFPFTNKEVIEKIICFFVTSPSSLYHRLWWTLEEFPALKEFVDPNGDLNEVFPTNSVMLSLVSVSWH